jgi:octaprenyl-diphosphate synthase
VSQIENETAASTRMREVYGPVASEMAAVEQILRTELRSDFPSVDDLVRYGCLLGGKRLRPVLLLLAGKCVGEVNDDHLTLAAVVEMIHTATLVHDDVLDEADTRRHLATVNSRWDNKASVLLGDFLFTHAFYLASTLESTWACRAIGRATNIVCEGELRQKGSRGDFALDEAEYTEIIAAKTAELCACSCQLGAYHAGATPDIVDRFMRYGRDLGIAFQIADDVLDLAGDEKTIGKSLGTDLEQQKPTLPIIRTLQVAPPEEREHLLAILNREPDQADEDLLPLLKKHDAIDYSLDTARGFARRAADEIRDLEPSPSLTTLIMITDFVVNRSM